MTETLQPGSSGDILVADHEVEPIPQEELTEEDVRKIEFALIAYDPLPESLESEVLEPEYGFDASQNLLARFTDIGFMSARLLPKFQTCSDVELLRRTISVLVTAMRVIALVDEWVPPNYDDFTDDDATKLQDDADTFRQRISPVFDALLERIRFLENRN